MGTATDSTGFGSDGPVIRVALRILDDRERQHLSQIMALTAQRTGWTLLTVPSAEADLVFVNPDEPGSRILLDRSRNGSKPIAVAYGGDDGKDTSLAKPARSTALHQLLEQLRERLASNPAEQPDSPPSTPARQDRAVACTEDYAHLISFLAGVRERPTPIKISLDESNFLAIDPRPGIAYLFGTDVRTALGPALTRLSALPAGSISSMPRREFTQVLVDTPSDRISIEELAWTVSHQSTPSASQPSDVVDQPFRLRHWPNFSRLPHKQLHLLWAGSLMRGSMTLSQLAARSPDGMLSAARFYNSCLLSGLIEHGSKTRKQIHGGEKAQARSNVFRRIIDKLAG